VIAPGGPNAYGEPTWTLHDPARNAYFQLDWPTYELMWRWGLGRTDRLLEVVTSETTLDLGPDDVARVIQFLHGAELLAPGLLSPAELASRARAKRVGALKWLVHNYLFMRIPLVRPDRALSVLAKAAAPLYSRAFLLMSLCALLLGAWQISQQWEAFRATFVDHISPAGALRYALVMVGVKIVHELGHAITAKRYGCRVPTMGLALLVLWPVAYTDTSDAWKLTSRRQRLAISSAGIAAELMLACWATALWPLLPAGGLKTAVFLVCTTTWVSTLIVNLNPLMRFDGYYILSDLLNVPNMQSRAFAMARWRMRCWLLGAVEDPPEQVPPRLRGQLIALSWAIWIYRLGLYIGIALLVYHFFIKALGIVLFVIEIWFFIAKPVFSELREWWVRRGELMKNRRPKFLLAAGGVLLVVGLLPLPSHITSTGVLQPARKQIVQAPSAGRLVSLVSAGDTIKAGQTLAVLQSPQVTESEAVSEADLLQAQAQAQAAAMDGQFRSQYSVAGSQLDAAEANLRTAQIARERLEVRAAFEGQVVEVEPDLHPGEWVEHAAPLAIVTGVGQLTAVTYLTETQARQVRSGTGARFVAESAAGPVVAMTVTEIAPAPTRSLPSGLFAFGSGGGVIAHLKEGGWQTEEPVFRVRLTAQATSFDPGRTWRGTVAIRGENSPVLLRAGRRVAAILVRESGF
jgi:putative peptide zinc metalloprotease protein